MNGPAQYLHIRFILISLANLLVIALLIVVFMLAVALRQPEKQRLSTIEAVPSPDEADEKDLPIPDPALQHLAERRCTGPSYDGDSHRLARVFPLPALSQSSAVLSRRPPPDLE